MAPIIPVKKVTRLEQPLQKVLELLAGNGGQIILPLMADEANKLEAQFAQEYWIHHCPWGVPGDMIWVAEPFKVVKECKELSGYTIHVEFEDGTVKQFERKTPSTIHATQEAASKMPVDLCRCLLTISEVAYESNTGSWVLTVVLQ